ncbi:MAG: peptidoglycan-binding protein [Hyphomicrobiales bacterium]
MNIVTGLPSMIPVRIVNLILLACLLGAGFGGGATAARADISVGIVDEDGVRRAIKEYLDSGASLPLSIKAHKEGLEDYYLQSKGAFLWIQPGKLDAFAELLSSSAEDGLFPRDYAVDHIRKLRDTVHSKDMRLRAWLELSYSSFLIRYAQDLGGGRILPNKIDSDIFIDRARPNGAAILEAFSKSGSMNDFSLSQMPADEQYQRLRGKLAEYRLIAEGGGWTTVPRGPALKPGMKGRRVEKLRARLEFSGDIEYSGTNRSSFDTGLKEAVKRFQGRNGIKADGVAGKRAIVTLNIPASDRVRQIEVNMERWRWIRDVQSQRLLTINLANNSFRYEVGTEIVQQNHLSRRKRNAKTPVLSDQISSVIVRPSDIVPPEIAGPAYFDKASSDPKKFADKGAQIYYKGRNVPAEAVDWETYSTENFPFTVRRPLRKGDPAGYVRLVFSGTDAACLGGAVPQKAGGRKDQFAPDCLTLVRADEFANALLAQNSQTLDAILANEKRQHSVYSSPFDQPIPVRILYATAWVDDGGNLHFRPDYAHRDLKLYKALEGRHSNR